MRACVCVCEMYVVNKIKEQRSKCVRPEKKNRNELRNKQALEKERKGKTTRMNGLSNKLDVCNVCVLQLDVQYSFKTVFECDWLCVSVSVCVCVSFS